MTRFCPGTFLSTLSLRRATLPTDGLFFFVRYFYPRSPCGERRANNQPGQQGQHISIHALLAESDRRHCGDDGRPIHFYPRSPCGERRSGRPGTRRRDAISIHALLAESDSGRHIRKTRNEHFYPRSPCGERPSSTVIVILRKKFLSTLSLRRATTVQIVIIVVDALFLSTLSLRRATVGQKRLRQKLAISIHALLAESDGISLTLIIGFLGFLSTLSLRRAT